MQGLEILKGTKGASALGMIEAAAAAEHGDYDTALGIWVELAHAGNAQAQAEIGNCFMHGLGVIADGELALRWLTLAAKAGNARGQRLLGDYFPPRRPWQA